MSKEYANSPANNSINSREKSINLCDEWERQISMCLRLGFHKALGMQIEEYLLSIPKFQIPPQEAVEHNGRLLLVEPRIPARVQLRNAGYKYFMNGVPCDNVANRNKNPYMILVQEGSGKNIDYLTNPNGSTLLEGAALLIAYPEVLDRHPVALPGSSVFSFDRDCRPYEKIPCINRWSDGLVGMGADFKGCLEDEGAIPAVSTRIT